MDKSPGGAGGHCVRHRLRPSLCGQGQPRYLDLVIDQPFILTERNASYRFILDQYLAAQGKEIHPFLEIGNTEFIISLLRKNLGVSFLPEFTIHQDIINGELAVLDVRDFYMRTWRQIVYHKDKWVTREMDAFLRLAT